jgi:hypothetical protein
MSTSAVRFNCPSCNVRIKASAQLLGQWRNCPACGRPFLVARPKRQDAGPVLVLVEGEERCSLGVLHRRSA